MSRVCAGCLSSCAAVASVSQGPLAFTTSKKSNRNTLFHNAYRSHRERRRRRRRSSARAISRNCSQLDHFSLRRCHLSFPTQPPPPCFKRHESSLSKYKSDSCQATLDHSGYEESLNKRKPPSSRDWLWTCRRDSAWQSARPGHRRCAYGGSAFQRRETQRAIQERPQQYQRCLRLI